MSRIPQRKIPTRFRDLTVELSPTSALTAFSRNAHTHSKKQIRQIAESIRVFGWTNPILTDANGVVIAGHGRLEAAKLLGIDQVPVIRIANMSEAQKRAYILADNKLAENAGWDQELLRLELQGLLEMEPDFEITATGFSMGEIDAAISDWDDGEEDEAEHLPALDSSLPPITQLGDLWELGGNRLLCADATKRESFDKLMGSELAEMGFSDPPFNVRINGHVSGLGHSEFAMASGEMSASEYVAFLQQTNGLIADYSRDGAIAFVCMDWRHIIDLLTAGLSVYDQLLNLCIWVKTNGGMGSLYRSQYEIVAVFKKGAAPHINNVELGRYGRNRTNVWEFDSAGTQARKGNNVLELHPTVKPVQLVMEALLDCSNRGDIVLDCFLGSGTTLLAAERTGRICRGIELDPLYVDTAIRRWQNLTGRDAVRVSDGKLFRDIEAEKENKVMFGKATLEQVTVEHAAAEQAIIEFDYDAAAELFPSRRQKSRRRPIGYKRFGHAADAIRFAIEELPPEFLLGACLEVDEERYNDQAIRHLYDSMDYPLIRSAQA